MATDTPADFSAPSDNIVDTKKVDALDGGWAVESHSKETEPPAVDTTAARAGPSDDLDDLVEASPARTPAATAVAAKPAAAAAKRPKQTFQQRIDELTGKNGQKDRELTVERQRVSDLEDRLSHLEKRPAGAPSAATIGQPAAVVATTAADKALELPDPPKYIDFDTDEQYNAAVVKWRTNTNAVLVAREEKIKADVSASVDRRFTAKNEEDRAAAVQGEMLGRIGKVAVDHPDFPELLQANAAVFTAITRERAPFIHDIVMNTADGGEFFYDLAKDPEAALALSELPLPTRPLADAVRASPASRLLMKHFATDAGREDFERLRTLHPLRVLAEVGRLEHALETADSGSVKSATRPISNAVPPARPPVGSPRARDPQGQGNSNTSFDDWMADEDAREKAERLAAFGVTATA